MSKALVLIDLEKEWQMPDSDYYLGDLEQLIEKNNRLIEYCRNQGYKIIFTVHEEKDSNKEFSVVAGRTALLDNLNYRSEDSVIKKNKISPFFQTTMDSELKNIDTVVVTGVLTNLCVRSFVQDAYDRDLAITIIDDCCQALDEKTHEFTLHDLKTTREEIVIQTLADFTH